MHCDYNIPLGFKPGQEWVWWDFTITDFFITASQTNHYSSVNIAAVPPPPLPPMPRRHAPLYGFSIDIKLLILKLTEHCNICCK